MITMQVFLDKIEEIADLKPIYRNGGSGMDGSCDCIGLIIGALRRAGGKWTGTHGSNYAARNEMVNLDWAPMLEIGTVLYKAKEPGEAGYDLPPAYSADSDQRDYYHVGVVTSVSPLRITHCTSVKDGTSIRVDTRQGAFLYGGRLKGLDYDNKEVIPVNKSARVTAASGTFVRMRSGPSTQEDTLAKVPVGTLVSIVGNSGDWDLIQYKDLQGWMMAVFLEHTDAAVPPPVPDDKDAWLEIEALAERLLSLARAKKGAN